MGCRDSGRELDGGKASSISTSGAATTPMNSEPQDLSDRLNDAIARHRAGQIAAAAAGYEDVLARDPGNFDALHFLGLILLQAGYAKRATTLLERAVEVHPDAFPAIHQLGNAYVAAGRSGDAVTRFQHAIALAPGYAPAHESLARLHYVRGRRDDAVAEFTTVARLQPDDACAHNNLGTALGQIGHYEDAVASFDRALAVDPRFQVAMVNAAMALTQLGRRVDATGYFVRVMAQQPEQASVCYQAGFHFYAQGMRAEARAAFEQALRRDPEYVEARWALMISELPLAYGPDEDPSTFRERFSAALQSIDTWFDASRTHLGQRAVGNQQPFYLAFHPVDVAPLLRRYDDLCVRLMNGNHTPSITPARRPGSTRPIRLVIASAYFHDQSVWTALVRGWCTHLDRRRIELHLIHTGSTADEQTAIARAQATSFHAELADLPQWVELVRRLEPDVILYPELGMDATCARLACLRLARVQAVSWGHPVTSGLPTIDYYLSAKLFEPPGCAAHYREQLVQLPNLGCYYEPLVPDEIAPDWNSLGVDPAPPRLVCAGTPYKYFPEHDRHFVEIARRLGRCQFLFFQDMAPSLSRQIKDRLDAAFRQGGLDATHFIRFLPLQSRPAFFGLMRECDVYLDTIGFSGFNSAMQAVECELPVVAWEARFMRGRLGSGILRRMGMDDLIVRDSNAYVAAAVRVCEDTRSRGDVKRRMRAASNLLYRDVGAVAALGEFLVRAVNEA
jgi:predicted O-linked N-acetylglucosamine transferase (SPINDLY family)